MTNFRIGKYAYFCYNVIHLSKIKEFIQNHLLNNQLFGKLNLYSINRRVKYGSKNKVNY